MAEVNRPGISCPEPGDSLSADYFRLNYVCDESTVDGSYRDNEAQIARILHYLSNSPHIDSIAIYSYVSPEGSFRRNAELSLLRAQSAMDFILKNSAGRTDLSPENIRLYPMNENWKGLEAMVRESYAGSDRDDVIRLIADSTLSHQARKARLMALDGGRTWDILKADYMPSLRYATWVCHWEKPAPESEPLEIIRGGIIKIYSGYRTIHFPA
ncbi:MAG: hypothetical protein ACI4TU_04615 [Candidatus Cryptobacteroides sp.]